MGYGSYDYYSASYNPATGTYSVSSNTASGTGVSLTDKATTGNASILGDVTADGFSTGSLTKYTYVGLANTGSGTIGFIASVTNGAGVTTYYLFVTHGTAVSTGTTGTTTNDNPSDGTTQWNLATSSPYCFLAGTRIRTPQGETEVEALKIGDLVQTADGRACPVTWIGVSTVSRIFADPLRVLPVRIRAGALDENVPARDLLLSPCHGVLVDGVLVNAGALVNGTTITRETGVPVVFTYYHVELEDHSLILAENTPAETFVDNVDRMAFDNWAEFQALYPQGRQVPEMALPRAKSHRQVPQKVRAHVQAREALLAPQTVVRAA